MILLSTKKSVYFDKQKTSFYAFHFMKKKAHDLSYQKMSDPCKIPRCTRPSFALCHCCEKPICNFHINEHSELLLAQLNPLVDEINELNNQLQSVDVDQVNSDSREKLERWRTEYHKKIDLFFEKKCRELDQNMLKKTSQQTEKIGLLRSKINHSIDSRAITRQDLEFLKFSISQLKKDIKNIEQTYIQIHTRPLPILDNMLQITETIRPNIDLTTLPPPCKTINQPEKTFPVLISNHNFLLIHQGKNLCLVNQYMNIIRESLWSFNAIVDMCWSSTLNQFILISEDDLFLVDENITSIDKIRIMSDNKWFSCTCSDTSLFLSTSELGSSLSEFNLTPMIQFVKQWSSPFTCKKNENIDSIIYNNGTLALLITNPSEKSVRIELRFAQTLDYLWALPLGIKCTKNIAFHGCVLSFDEWLVADYEKCRLLHITKCGQIKSTIKYPLIPYCVHLFNQNILVVLTKTCKTFHQLA
jgi:hypothetical protein